MRLFLPFKQFILFSVLFTSFSLLAACGHKNPLLDTNMIQVMDEEFFLRGGSYPIDECAYYYSYSKQNYSLKKKCNEWTQEYYRRLIDRHVIPTTTTVEDLRDPTFWKKIKALHFLGKEQ
ncbi:hypothetical protein [Candidatus Rickettsiella viridis]|nr:hypothetical protein [Candidatus Rickettsiella viridis]